jgi:hypothetical protein
MGFPRIGKGFLMDQIDPRNHFIHPPIEGEHLSRANRPCPVHPSYFINALAVAVILIAIFAAVWAAIAAQGVPA